ncbi:MAG: 50S ribosome-binding GTPase, partial [Planctomycetes bacterium]|nr:50S ribosome-binding GTPase [Planctomycetota bacterium]
RSNDDLSPGQVRFGTWVGAAVDTTTAGESVVVTPLVDGGIEIHCHGGSAAIQRIVADLQSCGVTPMEQDRWSRRDRSRLIREAEASLARCLTARTAAIAMDQVRGAMRNWASSRLESLAGGFVSPDRIRTEAEAMLRFAPLGLRLTDPFRIVLIGPPNVGKSSLLNAIVGYHRSITFDGAGTTRDVLHAETVIDGWPVRLSDTAGIRASAEPIEREGVVRARFAADQADLLIWVTEPALFDPVSGPICGEVCASLETSVSHQLPMIRLLNKADLRNRDQLPRHHPSIDSEGSPSDRWG